MRRINLIPPEFQAGKGMWIETVMSQLVVLASFLVVIALAINYAMTLSQRNALEQEMNQLRQELDQKQASGEAIKQSGATFRAQLKNLEQRMTSLSAKRRQLLHIKSDEFGWSEVLSEFYKSIPEKVWIEQLKLNFDGGQVRGGAFGNHHVGNFIVGLNRSPFFRNATFTRTEAGMLNERSIVNFELEFDLIRSAGRS